MGYENIGFPVICTTVDILPSNFYFFVSLTENVEVVDGKVTVCRDAVKGKCSRPNCKYYHPEVGSSGVASSTKSLR